MGVKGLWQLLEPVGRPVTLESLEGKVLSVDASILLNQAVKGMRDKSGNPLPNAHLVVLFNRLCKLLFYRIKPIFVFDGGVPILKKKTLAARRERKFKAKHGSNKAAEKLVKNYLKGKALETVTGVKSAKAIFRNNSPRDPDIFELPSLNRTQRAIQESSSSEEEDDDGVQQFIGQQDIEKKFQNPSSINVDSEDFRSLPEEIQHELIKDIMEEKKWSTIQSMPQDAFSFSDYQLQSVLQRGKLHQRLDELRKEMNNRNNGEVSGLSSQDALGADSSVQSQRIVSEDSGHYVLIKTSKNDTKENQDSSTVDNSSGGFFREDQKAQPQQTNPSSHHPVPSFDVDLTCENNSDSELDMSLLDVPEVVMLDVDKQNKKTSHGNFDIDVKRDGEGEIKSKDVLQHQDIEVLGKNMEETVQVQEQRLERISEENLISQEVVVLDGENRLNNEESESIEAQIEKRRNQIEMLLNKRRPQAQLSPRDVREKTVQGYPLPANPGAGEENKITVCNKPGTLLSTADDGSVEFRLHIETSSDEDEDEISPRDYEKSDKERMEDAEVRQDTQHHNQDESSAREGLGKGSSGVTGHEIKSDKDKMEDVKVRQDTQLQDQDESSVREGLGKDSSDVTELEMKSDKSDKMEDVNVRQETQRDDQDNSNIIEELQKDSFGETDRNEEVQISKAGNQGNVITQNVREDEEGMEIETKIEEEASVVPNEKTAEEETRPSLVSAPSEFVGTSKEDLEVMQVTLEMEQQSLQAEKARQERIAATVSTEMLAESQELLQLFGVPYVVSPMEAEAQCAFLDFTQQTSGTITDDSDVFLFGGTRVYKHIFNQNKHAELYTIEAINKHLALDRSKMINLAFITGSDYTEGIQGLGTVGAMEVLHEFNSVGFDALLKFKKWHDKTKNNKYSTQETKVKQKLRTLTLPLGFPSQEVFDSYVSPVIDESLEAFEWGKPDLHGLRLFAREKLGWSVIKTDEILLPALKQMNKQETQMRMDEFFQIKFHEPRKKSSKRVRRVINRFLNPLSSSESSSEDEGKNKNSSTSNDKVTGSSRSSSVKGKGKETGSRKKMVGSRVIRGRGRGKSRGRCPVGNAVNSEQFKDDGSCGRNVSDRSVASNDHVDSDTIMRDSDAGTKEGKESRLVDRKHKVEGRKIVKGITGKGRKTKNTQQKDKGSIKNKDSNAITDLQGDSLLNNVNSESKPQGDHNEENNKRNNLLSNFGDNNESMLGFINIDNVNNQKYKIPKKSFDSRKEESGCSSFEKINDDSSTSSDSDSEECRSTSLSLGNIQWTNKNGGRGVGRKRTRGRGRGRGSAVKRSKLEKMGK